MDEHMLVLSMYEFPFPHVSRCVREGGKKSLFINDVCHHSFRRRGEFETNSSNCTPFVTPSK